MRTGDDGQERADAWRRRLSTLAVLVGAVLVTIAVLGAGGVLAQEPQPQEPRPDPTSARRLWQRDCAVCHGPEGEGTTRGPDITSSGTAGVDFMLRTGRMPISTKNAPIRRREPAYTEGQIEALVEYVGSFMAAGAEVPEVEADPLDVAKGGDLYRLHCVACHQMAGTGGVLIGSKQAPSLHHTDAIETVEAIRFGPGTMPKWSPEDISEDDATAIASYIALVLQQPRDEGGIALGHFGPWSEGFVAWFGGLGSLLVAAGWIGRRT